MSEQPASSDETKTPTESEIYDRQIRLWGADSQAKMQQSKVLYISVTGLSAEVIKNLVLAGIAATVCDTRPYDATREPPHFLSPMTGSTAAFASIAHAVQPQIESLNPLLGSCPILNMKVEDLTAEDLKPFSIVVASQISMTQVVRLSQLVVAQGAKFYVGDCFGMNGAAMIDLGPTFQYRPEQGKNKLLDPTPQKKYVPISDLLQVPLKDCINRFHKTPPRTWLLYRCILEYKEQTGVWPSADQTGDVKSPKEVWAAFLQAQGASASDADLDTLSQTALAQVPPVCAVLGGMLGNEIIKAISGKGQPANNTLLLEGSLCKAWTFLVEPKTPK